MAILESEVLVGLMGTNALHFENLDYEIPRSKDAYGKLRIPRGTKILVKVADLPSGSGVNLQKYAISVANIAKTNSIMKSY